LIFDGSYPIFSTNSSRDLILFPLAKEDIFSIFNWDWMLFKDTCNFEAVNDVFVFSYACPFGPLDGPPSHKTQNKFSCSQQLSWDNELVFVGMQFAIFPTLFQMMIVVYAGK
jgi:hypothetical protein